MKKLFFIIILFFHLNIFSKTKVLIMADSGYQPYSYLKEDKVAGLYFEIYNKIFEKMKDYDIKIEAIPWKRALNDVEKGKAFAVFPPYFRPKDRAWMDYSDKVYDENVSLYCKKNSGFADKKKWPDEFKGLVLGINSGFSFGELVDVPLKAGLIELDEGGVTTSQCLVKLAKNRFKCYMNDDISIQIELKKSKINDELNEKIVKVLNLKIEPSYLGFAKDVKKFKYKKDFIKQFNQVLAEMKKSGEYEKIYNQFIKNEL